MRDGSRAQGRRARQTTGDADFVTPAFRLETERLSLCPWESGDWTAFRPIATDPEVMRYITGGEPWLDGQIQEFVDRQIDCQRRRGFCLWKLISKADGRLVGFCGLQPWRDSDEIEIGWWLARDCWGQGLATEAATAALRHGFDAAGLKRLIAVIHKSNSRSRRVAQKLGMGFEKMIPFRGMELLIYSMENGCGNGA
jgi:ribosomal-protein-alanine N-acetyltransferase